jgi:hypothetical protein
MGVPTVPVITQSFHELVTSIAYKKGIPNMRIVSIPFLGSCLRRERRSGTVLTVNSTDFRFFVSSSQWTGTATGAPARARVE